MFPWTIKIRSDLDFASFHLAISEESSTRHRSTLDSRSETESFPLRRKEQSQATF